MERTTVSLYASFSWVLWGYFRNGVIRTPIFLQIQSDRGGSASGEINKYQCIYPSGSSSEGMHVLISHAHHFDPIHNAVSVSHHCLSRCRHLKSRGAGGVTTEMTQKPVFQMFPVFQKRREPQTAGLTALEHQWIQYESCGVPIKNGVPGKEGNTFRLLPPLLAVPRDRAIRGNSRTGQRRRGFPQAELFEGMPIFLEAASEPTLMVSW